MRAPVLSCALCLALLLPGAALAQEDDRGYLTAFLEDNLSDAGRKITITGFEGALSSRATITRLEIADDAGVWITLDGVVLDWSRSSLLSGEVVVNELSAETIARTVLRAIDAEPSILDGVHADLKAVVERDPASGRLIEPLPSVSTVLNLLAQSSA